MAEALLVNGRAKSQDFFKMESSSDSKTQKHKKRLENDNERANFYKGLYDQIVHREKRRANDDWIRGVLCKLDAVGMAKKDMNVQNCDSLYGCVDTLNPTDTLLHKVVLFNRDVRLIQRLVKIEPGLLNFPRVSTRFEGQTVLHIAVSTRNMEVVKCILNLRKKAEKEKTTSILKARAIGTEFASTVLMGELPFTTAALTLDKEIVNLLLGDDPDLYKEVNSKQETVFHTLVRWAALRSENGKLSEEEEEKRTKAIVDMMRYISRHMMTRNAGEAVEVWKRENQDGLSALKLAATLGASKVFEFIINLEDVYRFNNMEDGISNTYRYDVTEIDSVAQKAWLRHQVLDEDIANSSMGKNRVGHKDVEGGNGCPRENACSKCCKKFFAISCCCLRGTPHELKLHTALEMISNLSPCKSSDFFKIGLVSEIVREKWLEYRKYFYLFAFLHLALMSLLTAYAVCRAIVNSRDLARAMNVTTVPDYSTQEKYVEVVKYLTIPAFLVPLGQELYALLFSAGHFCFNTNRQFKQYRISLMIFSLSLFADFIATFVDRKFNFFLILALLNGYFFCTFFIRVFRKFAFFIELFTKVIVGDMFRVSLFLFLSLVSFSVSMFLIFKSSYPTEDDFDTVARALMTMFKAMLGLDPIDGLYQPREAWLAYALFVIFVFLAFLLLLNALIAMMSQTCIYVAEQRDLHYELQRLSVIVMMEGYLPRWCTYNTGKESDKLAHIDGSKQKSVWRYLMFLQMKGTYATVEEQDDEHTPVNGTGQSENRQKKANGTQTLVTLPGTAAPHGILVRDGEEDSWNFVRLGDTRYLDIGTENGVATVPLPLAQTHGRRQSRP